MLAAKTEGKRPLRSRHKCEDDVETELGEIWCKCVNWIQLAKDTVQWRAYVKTILMHIRVP